VDISPETHLAKYLTSSPTVASVYAGHQRLAISVRFRNLKGARMLPLYAARIEDLGQGDFVKVDCAACHHVALLTPEALLRIGLRPVAKVLDVKARLREEGASRRFDQAAGQGT
jgi:hypothetical protein